MRPASVLRTATCASRRASRCRTSSSADTRRAHVRGRSRPHGYGVAVARTAHDTRDKLITIGQHLFAEQGVFRVPLRTVIERAGQKNTSALHYHFGGREGLLNAIIERHNDGIEDERAEMLARIIADHAENDIAE